MGEIADALRRASASRPFGRSRGSASGAPASGDGAEAERSGPGEAPDDLRARLREHASALQIARPEPTDPAVTLEEGPSLEACRHVALAVRGQLESRGAQSLAVVSALRDEGKTTTSLNLALALASLSPQREVALLDLDLRRPSLSQVLGVRTPKGIEDVLAGDAALDEARIEYGEPPLDVFPSVRPLRSAHQVLTRRALADLFDELERRYAFIVVDTPPTLLLPDSRLILERVPLCVPVARAGISRVRAFRTLLETLPRGQVLSTLLNGVKPDPQYYQGYDYGDEDVDRKRKRSRRGVA